MWFKFMHAMTISNRTTFFRTDQKPSKRAIRSDNPGISHTAHTSTLYFNSETTLMSRQWTLQVYKCSPTSWINRSIFDCIPQYLNSTLQSLYAHMMGYFPGLFLYSWIQSSDRGPLLVFIDLYSFGSSSALYSCGGIGSLTISIGSVEKTEVDRHFLNKRRNIFQELFVLASTRSIIAI